MAPAGGCDKGAPRRQLRHTAFVAGTKVESPVQPPNKKAPETISDALKIVKEVFGSYSPRLKTMETTVTSSPPIFIVSP